MSGTGLITVADEEGVGVPDGWGRMACGVLCTTVACGVTLLLLLVLVVSVEAGMEVTIVLLEEGREEEEEEGWRMMMVLEPGPPACWEV